MHIQWDWRSLSHNKKLTNELVLRLYDKPWDWDYLTKSLITRELDKLSRKYFDKWRNKVYIIHRDRLFSPTLDILKLRIRDRDMGLRAQLTGR